MRFALCAAGAFFCVGVVYAIAFSRLSISTRKGAYRFRAYLCVGTAIVLSGVAALLHEADLPTYEVSGVIETAQIHAEGKGHRTYLRIRVDSRADVAVNADGISPYFHSGQLTDVRYQGVSGHILHARFLSSTGKQEGVFNGTDAWSLYWWTLMGVLVVVVGIRKNKRDPEGAEGPLQLSYGKDGGL